MNGGVETARDDVTLSAADAPPIWGSVSRASRPFARIFFSVVGKMMPVSKKLLLSC